MSAISSDTCAICGRGGTPLGESVHPECARWAADFADEPDDACVGCGGAPCVCEMGGEG